MQYVAGAAVACSPRDGTACVIFHNQRLGSPMRIEQPKDESSDPP
jgi:hypothetical protein